MKRQLMHGVTGIVALTVALTASGAASPAAGASGASALRPSVHRHAVSRGVVRPAVRVRSSERLALTGSVIRNSGSPGLVADAHSLVTLNGCAVTTSGTDGNGVIANGDQARVHAANSTIKAGAAPAALAAGGGQITLDNAYVATSGEHPPAVRADRGGTVIVHGGTIAASGLVALSAGMVQLYRVAGTARGERAVIMVEPGGSVDAVDSELSGASGVVLGGASAYTMTGGSLCAATGPAFHASGPANVSVRGGATVTSGTGVLATVAAWGSLELTASGARLDGDVIGAASVALTRGSTLTGAIRHGTLALDSSSRWTVTGASALAGLTGAIASIDGNGHDVYYDPRHPASGWLRHRTYGLRGGGRLIPARDPEDLRPVSRA